MPNTVRRGQNLIPELLEILRTGKAEGDLLRVRQEHYPAIREYQQAALSIGSFVGGFGLTPEVWSEHAAVLDEETREAAALIHDAIADAARALAEETDDAKQRRHWSRIVERASTASSIFAGRIDIQASGEARLSMSVTLVGGRSRRTVSKIAVTFRDPAAAE